MPISALTEQDVFPNVPRGTPGLWRQLTIQERARLRMTPTPLTVRQVFDERTGPLRDEPDQVQRIVGTRS
jgi:hypothetical protein